MKQSNKRKREVVVRQPFWGNGMLRRSGEVIPRSGANLTDLLQAKFVVPLESDDEEFVVTCDCGRRFVDDEHCAAHIAWDHEGKPAPASEEGPPAPAEPVGVTPGEGPGGRDEVGLHPVGRRVA